jgi:hypothetical protein
MVYNKNSTIDFWDAVNNLMSGIKDDYYNWTNPDGVEGNIKDIKLNSIQNFNESLNIKVGRKYTKVLQGSSVWGFIANQDGTHKGIPHRKGDVFKAAGWRAPAKWARGNIFDGGKFYRWTGPNYLV